MQLDVAIGRTGRVGVLEVAVVFRGAVGVSAGAYEAAGTVEVMVDPAAVRVERVSLTVDAAVVIPERDILTAGTVLVVVERAALTVVATEETLVVMVQRLETATGTFGAVILAVTWAF